MMQTVIALHWLSIMEMDLKVSVRVTLWAYLALRNTTKIQNVYIYVSNDKLLQDICYGNVAKSIREVDVYIEEYSDQDLQNTNGEELREDGFGGDKISSGDVGKGDLDKGGVTQNDMCEGGVNQDDVGEGGVGEEDVDEGGVTQNDLSDCDLCYSDEYNMKDSDSDVGEGDVGKGNIEVGEVDVSKGDVGEGDSGGEDVSDGDVGGEDVGYVGEEDVDKDGEDTSDSDEYNMVDDMGEGNESDDDDALFEKYIDIDVEWVGEGNEGGSGQVQSDENTCGEEDIVSADDLNSAKGSDDENEKESWRFKSKLKSDPKRNVEGFKKDAMEEIRCNISTDQAYKAKRKALQLIKGFPDGQFELLWDYCNEIRRSNLGFTVVLGTDQSSGDNLFDRSDHRFCVIHLLENFKKAGYRSAAFKDALWRAAKACTPNEFTKRMQQIRNLDESATVWLSDKPPQQWSKSNFSCFPRKWDLSGVPCVHAISAITSQGEHIEDYVHQCYRVETYNKVHAHAIMPINGKSEWKKSDFIPPLPPNLGRSPGRPPVARRR
ncbi:hypothetical protein BUALT_Bualt07G0097900 [Buddleja alternifolia]|uniref:Zinc finger PMZ-type domain-containing protein n=1 Tax=Buddleja alternifolia TaxID=168488 RepID=A0AAV6XKA5_9LAMI|nr:hypothetical protein BUALT_Bualt07G0097900 [Buddleja alternifolia]